MMKAAVSGMLGRIVARAGGIAPERGEYGRTSLAFWKKLPTSVQKWVGYRVLAPAEIEGRRMLDKRPEFAAILASVNNSFALSSLSLLVILEMLEKRRPQSIAEFGSGLSTAILARYAELEEKAGRPAPLIYSFEHEADWLAETGRRLANFGLDHFVHLRHAPLTEQKLLGRTLTAYTLPVDELERETAGRRFDMCIIDGPPREIGRAGGLPIIAPFLAEKAIVLLDDSFRPGEQQALAEWGRAYGRGLGEPALYLTGGHGLAAVEWMRKNGVAAAAH